MDGTSSNEHLKSLVRKEFGDYIPVPSIADATDFNVCYFCCPESVKECWGPKKFIKSLVGHEETENQDKFISLGWALDYCTIKAEAHQTIDPKEEDVAIHGVDYESQELKGEFQVGSLLEGGTEKASQEILNLGKIKKISLTHKKLNDLLMKISEEFPPQLFKDSKNHHLYIIYAVLTAEKLESQEIESTNAGGSVTLSEVVPLTGSSEWKREQGHRLTRPKSMGRYPIAFKCGQVTVGKTKNRSDAETRKCLKLVGPRRFYQPLKKDHQAEVLTPEQSLDTTTTM